MSEINVTAVNMSELTQKAFMDCFFREGEDTSNKVEIKCIMNLFVFHPERLEEKRELLTALLNELPDEFKEGWSFLMFCKTKRGELWTGEHRVCEQLIAMAIGLDLVSFTFPRETWRVLPGAVPYITIK